MADHRDDVPELVAGDGYAARPLRASAVLQQAEAFTFGPARPHYRGLAAVGSLAAPPPHDRGSALWCGWEPRTEYQVLVRDSAHCGVLQTRTKQWWARRELHPHPLRDWVLNPARLLFRHVPVASPEHLVRLKSAVDKVNLTNASRAQVSSRFVLCAPCARRGFFVPSPLKTARTAIKILPYYVRR